MSDEAARGLLEGLYSDEGQDALARAGAVPVTERAFGEAMEGDAAAHVAGALEHGRLSALD